MICLMRLPVLRCMALALCLNWFGSAAAVGLGAIRVQSSLGQPLKAVIPLIGGDNADLTSTCFKTRLQTADGAGLSSAIVAISRSPSGDAVLLSTRQSINEPAILVDVTITCGALVHRDFSILLDPTELMPVVSDALPVAQPQIGAALRERAATQRNNRSTADSQQSTGQSPSNARPMSVPALPATVKNTAIAATSTLPLPVTTKASLPRKNVLKLSNEGFTDAELASMGHLKLSGNMADTVRPVDAVQNDELLAARNRFAAVLRGEDPALLAQSERAASAQQLAALKSQLAAIERQRANDHAAVEELKNNSLPLNWTIGIVVVLLLILLIAGWLAWRLATVKRRAASAWDLAVASPQSSAPVAQQINDIEPKSVTPAQTKSVSTDFGHHPAPVTKTEAPLLSPKELLLPQTPRTEGLASPAKKEVVPLGFPHLPALDVAASAGSSAAAITAADQSDALQFYTSKVEHLKVEEISDVMQEAEFWMSLNDPHRAIEILEPYGNADVPDSPMPWLYLLDLYRGTDERAKYMALHEKATKLFNVHIPLWDEDGDLTDGRTLEDYPHVVEQICTLWETGDIFAYLESLIFDRRQGVREGFDLFVYQEIMLLLNMVRSYGRERSAVPFSDISDHQLAIE